MSKLRNIKIRILVFLNDKNKKSYLRIFKEVCSLILLKKEFPLYYFAKFLYRKEIVDYKSYLSQKEIRKIINHIQPEDNIIKNLVRNKLDFGYFLEEHNIDSPKIIGYNQKDKFQVKEQVFEINSEDDFSDFFENMLNDVDENKLFVKPFSEQGGKDCFILNNETLKTSAKEYMNKIILGNFLFQECIKQHSEINVINPDTVNSIRFNSYMDESGNSEIISAFMRFGRNGNVVDNGSSGGFYVPVDLKKGTLEHEGKQLMKFGGKVFYEHPDTKFNFSNFRIPFFNEACSLIYKTAPLIPFKMLGWDIAITHEGPILIEVNDNFSLFVADIAYGGYLKHPVIKEMIEKQNHV
ncbi:hypothetical protein GTQ40_14780 [Flavobacteriaceae bacterium R38]|nr:hypothetical protein [Flavobacteriaceae bacterium R38]